MPRRSQRATQSDDEHSTPPTPRSPNHESHGRVEAWFEDHEDNIQVFLIKMNRKQISIPKGKYIQTWWRCFSPTWSSKMMSYCPASRVFKWRSTRELGKTWLDSNQGVWKWEKVKLGLFQNSTRCNTMVNAWEILLLKSNTSMLVVSRWIKGYLVWLSQKSLFHVVATIQHWVREIWYSCTAFNIIYKWIGSMCFVITCSRPRGSQILGFHTILQRIEALCIHILRGWCWTSCMSLMCLNMNIITIAMRGSRHWMAKSMICSTHSRPEMTLRMTECGGCLGSCIASLCLWFFSLSSVSFSWLFCISVGWLYQLYASVFCFQFLLAVFPSSINQMICNVCYLYAFVLFDESKGGEKLDNWKMDNWSH